MKIELSAKTIKAFVKGVENITEICLLTFDEDGVRTRIMNNDHTALLDLKIPKDSAEVYDFNNSTPIEIGVLIADVKDMTKSLVVKDTLTIEYNTGDPTWLVLSANGVEKKVRCKNASLIKRHKVPPTDHKWSANLPWKQMKAFLSSCAKEASFRTLANPTWIQFQASSDDETLTLQFDKDEVDLHIEGESLITHITPAHFLALQSVSVAKTVFLMKGNNGGVVETGWKEGGVILNGWIAPRT
tara:strand:+ start:363 stop:1091 length:729 start_codon:yes stop_codon:yes gene_type:complete